jgi:hypothetical protein
MTATGAFDLVTTAVEALSGLANVYDGPPLTQDEPATYVIIGGQGWADDDDQPAWTTDAEWRSVPIGAGSREEAVSIPCEVTAWSGSGTWADLRAEAATLFDSVADALLAKATWDDCPQTLTYLTITNVSVSQQMLDPGMAVRVLFTLDARILL